MPLPSQVYSKQSAKQKEATYISSSFFNLWLEFPPLHIHFPHLSIHLWQFFVTSRSKEMRKQMISHKQEKEKFECINDIHPCIRIVSFISLYIYKMSTNSGQLSRLPEKNRISWSVERKGDQIETIKNWNT